MFVAFGIRGRRDAYPLSMTRAATSSILIEKSLLAVIPVFQRPPLVLKALYVWDQLRREKIQGQLTFHDGGLW